MNKLLLSALGFVFIAAAWTSCVEPPQYPNEPAIEFVSISTDTIDAVSGELLVTFSFTDGDGDLGFESFSEDSCGLCDSSCYSHPTYSLFLVDTRKGFVDGDSITCLTPFDMPYVPVKGSSKSISGEIDVKVTGIFCFPFLATDTVSFLITVKDRSGNFSNTIQTPTVFINCI